MRNIRLTVEYDGSSFRGWAAQPGLRTVSGHLTKALGELTGAEVKLIAASRTDSGVHAEGQVVNFRTGSRIPLERLKLAVNRKLSPDIMVRGIEEVKEGFSSRDNKGKLYSYTIALGDDVPSRVKRFAWQVTWDLDVSAMRRAAKTLIGRHDFSSFAVTDKRRVLKDPVRHVRSIRIKSSSLRELFGSLSGGSRAKAIKLEFLGDSFLYKMIRSIVGTLVEVGRGGRRAEDMEKILAAASRGEAGRTAPPEGLTLIKVIF